MEKKRFYHETNMDFVKAYNQAFDIAHKLDLYYNINVLDNWDSEDNDNISIENMSSAELDCVYRNLEDIIDLLTTYQKKIDNLATAREAVENVHANYVYELSRELGGAWYECGDNRYEWCDWDTEELRAYIEYDAETKTYQWINAECDHGEHGYIADEIDEAKEKAMLDWKRYH
jgi:hypothetical protein